MAVSLGPGISSRAHHEHTSNTTYRHPSCQPLAIAARIRGRTLPSDPHGGKPGLSTFPIQSPARGHFCYQYRLTITHPHSLSYRRPTHHPPGSNRIFTSPQATDSIRSTSPKRRSRGGRFIRRSKGRGLVLILRVCKRPKSYGRCGGRGKDCGLKSGLRFGAGPLFFLFFVLYVGH